MAAFTVEGLIRSASLFSFPQFATTHLYSTCGVRCRVYLCVLGVGGGGRERWLEEENACKAHIFHMLFWVTVSRHTPAIFF